MLLSIYPRIPAAWVYTYIYIALMGRPLPKYKAKLLKIAKQKAGNHLLIALSQRRGGFFGPVGMGIAIHWPPAFGELA